MQTKRDRKEGAQTRSLSRARPQSEHLKGRCSRVRDAPTLEDTEPSHKSVWFPVKVAVPPQRGSFAAKAALHSGAMSARSFVRDLENQRTVAAHRQNASGWLRLKRNATLSAGHHCNPQTGSEMYAMSDSCSLGEHVSAMCSFWAIFFTHLVGGGASALASTPPAQPRRLGERPRTRLASVVAAATRYRPCWSGNFASDARMPASARFAHFYCCLALVATRKPSRSGCPLLSRYG